MPDGHSPGQIGMIRRVVLHKDKEHGLGLAVIGGKQLGVPILGKSSLIPYEYRSNKYLTFSVRNLSESTGSSMWTDIYWRCYSKR